MAEKTVRESLEALSSSLAHAQRTERDSDYSAALLDGLVVLTAVVVSVTDNLERIAKAQEGIAQSCKTMTNVVEYNILTDGLPTRKV